MPQSGQDHIRDPLRLGAGEGAQAAADVQVHRAGQHLGEEVGVHRGEFTARHGTVHDLPEGGQTLLEDPVDRQGDLGVQLLDAVRADPEFSFDSVSQIHLPTWHRGRIALVGDAAHCAALFSGRGTSLALMGAHFPAAELEDAGGDHTVAFVRCEQRRRPYAEFAQNSVTDGGELTLVVRTFLWSDEVSSPRVPIAGSPEPMSAVSRRTEPQRRDRILAVTLDTIEERGLAGATYRTIAAAADVPLGSMTYHFPNRDDLIFIAFERFANDLFSPLDESMGDLEPGEDPRDRLVRMIVTDSRDRRRDMVLLAELYVLAIRDERYADLMRQWMRRAKDAISRHIHGVSGHVIDAVQEGIGLQRYFLPQEFTEDVVRRTLHDLIPQEETT